MEISRDELKEVKRIPHRWTRKVVFLNALKQEDRLTFRKCLQVYRGVGAAKKRGLKTMGLSC